MAGLSKVNEAFVDLRYKGDCFEWKWRKNNYLGWDLRWYVIPLEAISASLSFLSSFQFRSWKEYPIEFWWVNGLGSHFNIVPKTVFGGPTTFNGQEARNCAFFCVSKFRQTNSSKEKEFRQKNLRKYNVHVNHMFKVIQHIGYWSSIHCTLSW